MNAGDIQAAYGSVETPWDRDGETLLLTALLVTGLVFVTPVVHFVTGVPLLLLVMLVGGAYGVGALLLGRVVVGVYVGVLVTATFAADVPLAPAEFFREMPGMLGPRIYLVYAPLAALVAIVGWKERRRLLEVTAVDYVLGAFVAWTGVSALLGNPLRPDTALYFSLLMLLGWLVFSLVSRGVRRDYVGFRAVVLTVTVTVVGHALFGLLQFFNQRPFGASRLGEISYGFSAPEAGVISFGPLGSANLGLFVTGFTGMAFILASLLLLVLPVLLGVAIRRDGHGRMLAAGGFVVGAVVLRFTISDAARGGFVLAVATFLGLVHLRSAVDLLAPVRDRAEGDGGPGVAARLRSGASGVVPGSMCGGAVLFSIFYPTSLSGSGSRIRGIDGSPGPDDPSNGGTPTPDGTGTPDGATPTPDGTGTPDGATPTPDPASTPGDPPSGTPPGPGGEFSVPFFDLSNLGPRLQQYAVAVDLFRQRPITGIGGGNFMYHSTRYGLEDPIALHNIYLLLLVETGLPGFVLYSAALLLVLWNGWRLSGLLDEDRLLVLGLLAGIVGYLGFAFWDHLALDRPTSLFPFWALAGAIVGERYRRWDRGA